METERVLLRVASTEQEAPLVVFLGEPRGRDELELTGVDTASALQLIDRLLKCPPSQKTPLTAASLCASDRDALLAALHRLCWGDRIISTLLCGRCHQRFDISFQLSGMQRELYGQRGGEGSWRVPLGEDELFCCGSRSPDDGAQLLAQNCGATPDLIGEAVADLERIAPILDLDLDAVCPECGHSQLAHFDLQSFLLQRLISERESLLDELHLLAERYGWSLGEILSLGRSSRRSLARRIMDRRRR